MLSWKEIVQNYITKHSDRIQKTTRPLKDHLGVDYFTYHKIDLEGNYTVLVDRPDWAEHYVQNQLYRLDPYLRHPDVYQSGICKVEANGSEEYVDQIMSSGKKFHLDLCVLLIEKTKTGVEFFGFAGNQATCGIDTLSMNTPQLLKSFATHFRSEMSSLITQMSKEASSLKDLKGADFYTKDTIAPWALSEALLAFLTDLGLQKEVENFRKLSERERECLHYLFMGKSAKDTALIMNLSPRTIESYLENMKNKMGCYTKGDLFSLASLFYRI